MNTFGMKVKADCYIEFSSPSDLADIEWENLAEPLLFLGEGSNLLFTSDFKGTVLHSRIMGIEPVDALCTGADIFVRAGSGESMDEFCRVTAAKGWWGAENLSGIPGTVGAAPVQNVGAYGVEAADIIHSVDCFDVRTSQYVTFDNSQCAFAYRDSFFKHNRGRYIVLSVLFHLRADFCPRLEYAHLLEEVERNAQLSFATADPYNPVFNRGKQPQQPVTPVLVRDTVRIMRDAKLPDPKKIGSAGSFFKNPVVSSGKFAQVEAVLAADGRDIAANPVPHYPQQDGTVKIPAAFLIESCGLKGAASGGAAVWKRQPLVLVNASGQATAQDVLTLERHVIETVRKKFDIELSAEVDHI